MTDDWIILRCAGRSTLILASSLAEDGMDAWTPTQTQQIRAPRLTIPRSIKLPLLPSFVFAKARHLGDLLELANMVEKPRRGPNGGRLSRPAHREFSVFHHLDKIPMIADRDLDPLRAKEREIVPRKDRPHFDRGTMVRVNSGAFQGLKGKVERCKSGYALVIFTDWKRPAKIPTFLLGEDQALCAARRLDEAA
jgi:hypothetical protein